MTNHGDGRQAVLYRSRMNPFLGRTFEYSNRARGTGEPHEPKVETPQEEKPRKRCLSTWARLLAKVYQVDPLGRILEHLGLSAPEAQKPPPVQEILRVAEHGDGWGVPADWD